MNQKPETMHDIASGLVDWFVRDRIVEEGNRLHERYDSAARANFLVGAMTGYLFGRVRFVPVDQSVDMVDSDRLQKLLDVAEAAQMYADYHYGSDACEAILCPDGYDPTLIRSLIFAIQRLREGSE